MKNNYRILAAAVAGCLVFGNVTVVHADSKQGNEKASYTKYENVYVNLGTDGEASDAYVVNHFSIKDPGTITDYGNYEDVKNLTTLDTLTKKGNRVDFQAGKGEFYYQGEIKNAQLPWNFSIAYELDGKTVTGEELAGKDGKLKITFQSEKNDAATGTFYDNYLMQISLTLDCSKAENIVADGATIADAGADRQLSFTVLPGNDAKFTIEADVQNFEMSGFSIAAIPYHMDFDMDSFDMGDFTDQISELTDAVQKLDSGTDDLADGLEKLCKGNAGLLDGSRQLKNGIRKLSDNSSSIVEASSEIKKALETINAQLKNVDFSEMEKLTELPDGLKKLADALDGIESGLGTLDESYAKAYAALDQAMQAKNDTLSEQELGAVQKSVQGNAEASAACQKLLASYQQLQTIKGTYQKVKPAFEAVANALDSENETSVVTGIHKVSKNLRSVSKSLSGVSKTDIAGQMTKLKKGISSLSLQYGKFHSGLASYTQGLDTISKSYGSFQDGITSYLDGTVKLKDGAVKLSDGMGKFADGIMDMPAEIENTVDDMMDSFAGDDKPVVSFTDQKNETISSVQFVVSTKGIEVPKEQKVTETEQKQGFWERLKALFEK